MGLKVTVGIVGASPISFGAPIKSERGTGEPHAAFEERAWRERMHTDEKGIVFIPPNAIKNCISDVAKYLSESVPGKGKATYTKFFEAGIFVADPVSLGIKAADVVAERLFVPSDGKRGGGTRVWKNFPLILKWSGTAILYVLDPVLISKPEKIQEYLSHAGKFIGLGRFRPRNNGHYGRFNVGSFVTEKIA